MRWPARRSLLLWCLVMAAVASACSGGQQPTPSGSLTTGPAPQGGYRLGTFDLSSGSKEPCAPSSLCELPFTVTCPGVQNPARGTFIVLGADHPLRGMVVFTIGGLGVNAREDVLQADPLNRDLESNGLEVVVMRWTDPWLASAPGEEIGPARLACRPATAIKWAHDELYPKLKSPSPALGACGFCLTGNSGGATQIAEVLTFYGLASIVNAAIPSGGPPHAALAPGCLGQGDLAFEVWAAPIIDLSYGFHNNGACARHDPSFVPLWNRDSLDTAAGADYVYPKTRVVIIFGTDDNTTGVSHGKKWLAQLQAHHCPYVQEVVVPNMGHNLDAYPQGRAALLAALLGKVQT